MLTALLFILVISVLVFVHELGHFVMAKRAGMKVEEFGFGFPPRVWSKKSGETVYSINAIPFGGFVKIFGENGDGRTEPRAFGSKGFWPRMGVIVAGVVMNFVFAVPLLMAGNALGLRVGLFDEATATIARDVKVQIISVTADSPAQDAGLLAMDEIRGFRTSEGTLVTTKRPEEVQTFAHEHAGQDVRIVVARGSDVQEYPISLRANPPAGQGPIGIALAMTGVVRYPWYQALWRGIVDAGILFANTLIGYWLIIKSLFTDGAMLADVSGPIGIATLTGQAARIGINYLIQFVAMISINLAVLNILPFPALDGGRAVMLIAEKIKGSPLRHRTEALVNGVGFAILLVLMVAVTVRDIGKLF